MEKFKTASSFIEWVQVQKRFNKKTSLENMERFCSLLDNPQKKFKSIHITGTNGKGSTVSMLSSVFLDKGLNVGTFTSPYITCFNERISYNGISISDEDLLEVANEVIEIYPILEKESKFPTFFEFVTLCSFLYFSKKKDLDVAIMEVGMGGRLDSTNVITPVLSIVTNVALDHMSVLGNTVEEIFLEKLGIVKEKIPFVIGTDDCLLKIAEEVSLKQNTYFKKTSKKDVEYCNIDLNKTSFIYKGENYELSLIGYHQVDNAIVVIEAFSILKDLFNLNEQNLINGLKNAKWVGRLEKVSEDPVVYLDGGHNINGITRITEFIKSIKKDSGLVRAVVSISHDKEINEMIKLIDDTFDEVVFTKYTYSRSASAFELFELSNSNNKLYFENIDDSIEYVKKSKDYITFFIGSLYLVSEVRDKFLKNIRY